MKNSPSYAVLLFIICPFSVSDTFACMPHSSLLVTIGTYNGVVQGTHPDSSKVQFLEISNLEKPFGGEIHSGAHYFLHADESEAQAAISMRDYHIGDQIIMIADANNGNYSDYLAVYEVGRLVSSQSGALQITNKIGTIKEWGTKIFECGHYKIEGKAQTEAEFASGITSYLQAQNTPRNTYNQILSDMKQKIKAYFAMFLELFTMKI